MKGATALRDETALSQVKNLPLPVTILIGGVPSSEKLNALAALFRTPEKVAKILVGGSFVQPFHRVLGYSTGDSERVDESHIQMATGAATLCFTYSCLRCARGPHSNRARSVSAWKRR